MAPYTQGASVTFFLYFITYLYGPMLYNVSGYIHYGEKTKKTESLFYQVGVNCSLMMLSLMLNIPMLLMNSYYVQN